MHLLIWDRELELGQIKLSVYQQMVGFHNEVVSTCLFEVAWLRLNKFTFFPTFIPLWNYPSDKIVSDSTLQHFRINLMKYNFKISLLARLDLLSILLSLWVKHLI